MNNFNLAVIDPIKDTTNVRLQFSKITLDEEYASKWNAREKDFIVLTKGDELLRNTLYRVGGMNHPNLEKDEYFMLIKYVEAYYSDEIMRISKSKDPKHLDGKWCILNKNGDEMFVTNSSIHFPYIIANSCIYSIDNKYYNIETGELYCDSNNNISSDNYLFLENRYDKDISKRGVLKINKKDGSFELIQ